jgi:hypothetical protein
MPESLMVFDFGTNEDAAQHARHRLEGWRQAFRLGDRIQFKFERIVAEPAAEAAPPAEAAAEDAGDKKKPKAKSAKAKTTKKKKKEAAAAAEPATPAAAPADHLRLLVRLAFPNHEKLTYQRWFDRIPAEPLFESAEKQVLRPGKDDYDATKELFDSLA